MKPPLRESRQSTSRMLVTLASIGAAEDVEPHRVADVDAEALVRCPCSIDTSGSADGPCQNAPVDDALVRLEVVAIGDGVLARRASRARARPRSSRASSRRPSTPVTRARSTGISRDAPAPCAGSRQERPHAVHLTALHVDQEHVGRVGRHLDRELAEQVRLQRSHADDEEGAEADGEQDDARLVAGPRQVQHRVPQRERPRAARAARTSATSSAARPACSTSASTAKPTHTTRPTRSDAACQAVSATSAERHDARSRRCRVQSRRARAPSRRAAAATASRSRTCSSGTTENSSDTSTPMPMPCAAALQVTP